MNTRNLCFRSCIRFARWLGLSSTLLLCLWACVSHPLAQPKPEPVMQTDAQITIVPIRRLDLLFMVDNSRSMKPKQDKMKAQFPKLIEALRDPSDNSLPDMRIAILDSDLGAGYSGQCGEPGGYGDRGRFQMRDASACGANADARWLEYTKGEAVNFKGDVSQVFGCLAGNLGVEGCGFEHQLGSLSWAFFLDENESQLDFLRGEAYLGIVLLTDEDDCSAPPETGVFNNRERGEAWSLRCSNRSHQCDGTSLAFPTTAALSVPYASCHARTDATCDSTKVDTTKATDCNPLLNIAELAEAVKKLKGGGDEADDKILVAGIYGRPRSGDTSEARYRIDLVPDPTPTMTGLVYDNYPVCYDPDYPPAGADWDKTAAEHGAAGGLRIDAFLNEFPEQSRLAYSICESDFGPAMAGIGKALRNKMGSLCVPYKLVDKSDEAGLQADCRVAYRIPKEVTDAKGNTTIVYVEEPESLPACDATRALDCWQVRRGDPKGSAEEQDVAKRCPAEDGAWSQMVHVPRKPGSLLPDNSRIVMQCLTCVDPLPGMDPSKGCDY